MSSPLIISDLDLSGAVRPAGQSVAREERRAAPRIAIHAPAQLLAMGGDGLLECLADDVSTWGMHLRAPTGVHLTVGLRCELTLFEPQRIDLSHTLDDLAGMMLFATIIRTEPHRYGGDGYFGLGLRFDQPLPI